MSNHSNSTQQAPSTEQRFCPQCSLDICICEMLSPSCEERTMADLFSEAFRLLQRAQDLLLSARAKHESAYPDRAMPPNFTLSIAGPDEDGLYFVTSSVPGLFLGGHDLKAILQDVPRAVVTLRQHNGDERDASYEFRPKGSAPGAAAQGGASKEQAQSPEAPRNGGPEGSEASEKQGQNDGDACSAEEAAPKVHGGGEGVLEGGN